MDQRKVIGENIKAARKARGLSQRALAEKLGIAFQNLSVWENGKGAPSARYLMKLSEILQISLDKLTSPNAIPVSGILAPQEEAVSKSSMEKLEALLVEIKEELPAETAKEIQAGHTLKLIVKYLEEIMQTLKGSSYSSVTPQISRAADSVTPRSRNGVSSNIPLPPDDYPADKKQKWENNAASLLEWSRSPYSFWAPSWALEKFCMSMDTSGKAFGSEDVAANLKSIIESSNR